MITIGKFVYFNYTQYREQEGLSYGFAKSPDHERQIFLGTCYHVFPEIWDDQVQMSRMRNPEPFGLETPFVLEGREVVIDVREGKKGLVGNWCFIEEWRMMQDRHAIEQERRRVAVEEARRIEAWERAENPATIAIALAHGWVVVEGGNGRQRILERQFAGEAKPRRITRHLSSKTVSVSTRHLATVS